VTTDNEKIGSNDLPALHNAASSASMRAQKRYLAFFFSTLVLMIVGSTLSAVSLSNQNYRSLKAFLAGTAFGMSLIVTAALKTKRYEKDWYGGRAIAESVKTLAWRYMMQA